MGEGGGESRKGPQVRSEECMMGGSDERVRTGWGKRGGKHGLIKRRKLE